MKLIKKSAMTVVRDNKLLVVRKKGSRDYLMPGGKPEGNESAVEALNREIMEELGCRIESGSIQHLGVFEDLTSDGKSRVRIELFSGKLIGNPRPSGEIGEMVWVPADDSMRLTPVIANKILPFLISSGLLDANV